MPQEWDYLCTASPYHADALTEHMNEMARRGWDLLTVTSAPRGETGTHLFFWRRPARSRTT
jgi:hypothetical protein